MGDPRASHAAAALWPRSGCSGVFLAPASPASGIFALQPQLDRPGPVFDLEHAAVSLHVSLVLLAYAGFALGAAAGGLFLLREAPAGAAPAAAEAATDAGSNWQVLAGRLPPIERLEQVLRAARIDPAHCRTGPRLGLMRERYGVLVRPDPKIAWSFLVWTVYLGLLLLRLGFRQATRRLAWVFALVPCSSCSPSGARTCSPPSTIPDSCAP